MRALAAIALACVLALAPARAQLAQSGAGGAAGGPSYTGPGDVASGASAFWGLRAYSAAKAGNNAADIFCVTANTTKTIKTLANGNFDVASLTAACPSDTYHVATLYEQTGTNGNMVQATDASRPVLTLNCLNTSLPCLTFSGTQGMVATLTSVATPYTYVAVGERTGSVTSFGVILDTFLDGGSSGTSLLYANSANTIRYSVGQGTSFTETASDNAWHAFVGISNGTTGTTVVDNTAASGAVTSAATTNSAYIGMRNDGANGVPSKGAEFGVWPTNLNSTQYGNMCHNQFGYWATSTSC